MSQQRFILPNILVAWPWPRLINPHYAQVKAESAAWLESFKAFDPKAQVSFNKCDFNLLAALAYPLANKGNNSTIIQNPSYTHSQVEHLRTGCDLMNVFFIIDEYTDNNDGAYAAMIKDISMDALRNPYRPRPSDECIAGEIVRQFWARSVPIVTKECIRRFVNTFDTYLESVVNQARDREKKHIRSIEDYFNNRRDNIGTKPSFALLEFTLNIPDFVMEHPSIQMLTISVTDMIIIGNDLVSFKREHAEGNDAHNILTVVKNEFGRGLEHAVQWVDHHNKKLRADFLSAIEEIPSWNPTINDQVIQYIFGLANWARANDCWSFESGRYFGEHGLEFQSHRLVDLACGHPECTVGFQGSTKEGMRVTNFVVDKKPVALRDLVLVPFAMLPVPAGLSLNKLSFVVVLIIFTFLGSWLTRV